MHTPLKADGSSVQLLFSTRIINCFRFPSFVSYKYSVKEFYEHAEGNLGPMGVFSK